MATLWFPSEYGVAMPERLRSLTTDGLLDHAFSTTPAAEGWPIFSRDVHAVTAALTDASRDRKQPTIFQRYANAMGWTLFGSFAESD